MSCGGWVVSSLDFRTVGFSPCMGSNPIRDPFPRGRQQEVEKWRSGKVKKHILMIFSIWFGWWHHFLSTAVLWLAFSGTVCLGDMQFCTDLCLLPMNKFYLRPLSSTHCTTSRSGSPFWKTSNKQHCTTSRSGCKKHLKAYSSYQRGPIVMKLLSELWISLSQYLLVNNTCLSSELTKDVMYINGH